MPKKEIVIYNGFEFTRYPNAKRKSDREYYSGWVYFEGKVKKMRLHRYKWLIEKGSIPQGHHIHHIDENKNNNETENFECKEGRKHLSDHNKNVSKELKEFRIKVLLTKAIPASKKWHRSRKGREWHRKHASKTLIGAPVKRICLECGNKFTSITKVSNVKWCSPRCRKRVAARIFREKKKRLLTLHSS